MRGLYKAILTGDSAELDQVANYEALRYAVSRAIFCPRSDVVMDVRRAVLVTVVHGEARKAICLDGKAYDEIVDGLRAKCESLGASLEVIDGRDYTVKGTLRKRKA